jgi:hypothetical protein
MTPPALTLAYLVKSLVSLLDERGGDESCIAPAGFVSDLLNLLGLAWVVAVAD